AWDYSQGDASIVIGIVDTGVQWDHPDLAANIWTNPGEIPGNGIDDDGNDLVDDVRGWDFVGADYANWSEDNTPMPTAIGWHGTHVAGIASAVTNNATGIASIGFRCKILPVKVSADNDNRPGGPYILRGYTGILYAATMGAKIINCSWGGGGGSQFEQDIINIATQQGALVVAAAGNGNSGAFFSPSGYANVLSVGATDEFDNKASFSNFGETVDVSSPGVNIYSTMFLSTYASAGGTSMASPLVAGLAGLVRWKFPTLSPVQAGEQIRVTSDPIASFAGDFGHGRINALKAITDSTLPSVRMLSFSISDSLGGNGNGQGQPAETLDVTCNFYNFLRPTSSGATVQLTSVNGFVNVLTSAFPLSSLGTMYGVSKTFRVVINQNVPQSFNAILQLTYTDSSFTDLQRFSFLVNPTYATHNINAIQVSLTNNGRIGFFDFPSNSLGMGFIFNGINHLFEGGLLIGTSATRLVDVVRNETPGGQNADLYSQDFFTLKTPGTVSQQDGHTSFTDANAPLPIGLSVDLDSYAFSEPGHDRYVILSYAIKNTTTEAISNLFAAIFLDWDIGEYDSNFTSYDAARSLGYAYEVGSAMQKEYLGIVALEGAASYRALNRDFVDLTRAGKWDWISAGFGITSIGPTDIHHVISSGPYQIAPGATQRVGFALVAGDSSLANIQQNADAAKVKWDAILNPTDVKEPGTNAALEFRLQQNYPNPFNPATTFEFQIHRPGYVSLRIFDLLGREVAKVVDGTLNAGSHRSLWNAHGLPSGIYFSRLQLIEESGQGHVETKKIVFLR
ncbi:MAG: S8 family peptidase, partial [Ignavibacteriales bacterium]|nr:S8 family peptidase [Ignavibacteriales bacterium]